MTRNHFRLSHLQEDSNSEKRILDVARDVLQQLGVTSRRRNLTRIVWMGAHVIVPASVTFSPLSPDQCSFDGHAVMMSRSLENRLDAEDWKPILASALIYETKSKLSILLRFLGVMLLAIMGILASFIPSGAPPQPSGGDYRLGISIALALLVVTPLATWLFSHELRNVRLAADRRATQIIEPAVFLAVLKKIDQFHLPQLEKRKRGGLRLDIQSHIPSISDRIRAIEKSMEK